MKRVSEGQLDQFFGLKKFPTPFFLQKFFSTLIATWPPCHIGESSFNYRFQITILRQLRLTTINFV